jgi:hypothetical protein
MLRTLEKLATVVTDYTIGTVIVIVHIARAEREQRPRRALMN